MNPFFWLFDTIIGLYILVIVAAAIFSWLIAFEVANPRNPTVRTIGAFLYQITEPALRPIREFLPNLGGIDISPIILWIALMFLRYFVHWIFGVPFIGGLFF